MTGRLRRDGTRSGHRHKGRVGPKRSVALQFATWKGASLVRLTPKSDGPWRVTGNERAGLSVRAATLVANKDFEAVSCDARIEGSSIIVTLPGDFALKDKAMVRPPSRKP